MRVFYSLTLRYFIDVVNEFVGVVWIECCYDLFEIRYDNTAHSTGREDAVNFRHETVHFIHEKVLEDVAAKNCCNRGISEWKRLGNIQILQSAKKAQLMLRQALFGHLSNGVQNLGCKRNSRNPNMRRDIRV